MAGSPGFLPSDCPTLGMCLWVAQRTPQCGTWHVEGSNMPWWAQNLSQSKQSKLSWHWPIKYPPSYIVRKLKIVQWSLCKLINLHNNWKMWMQIAMFCAIYKMRKVVKMRGTYMCSITSAVKCTAVNGPIFVRPALMHYVNCKDQNLCHTCCSQANTTLTSQPRRLISQHA